MRLACYEIVEDDGSFYGHIPVIRGVWANAKTLEACREELESVLEGWVLVSIADHSAIPEFRRKTTAKARRQVGKDLAAACWAGHEAKRPASSRKPAKKRATNPL
jgi:predicted RNase H-like HicB family nuclease